MRQINTECMDKVAYKGQEIAFGKCRKNEYGEYVIKVYVDGVYDEDKTIYEESREDAEVTKAETIRLYAEAEAKRPVVYRLRVTSRKTGETLVTGKSWPTRKVAEYVAKSAFATFNCKVEIIEEVQG